jgi:hypothetical protein
MELFFELEIVYIVIALFFLAVTLFVTTRAFMPKVAFKRGMISVTLLFVVMINLHFSLTTKRMDGVKEIFNEGGVIICENKMRRTISRSILISQELGWKIEGDKFTSPNYERDFHTARCIDYSPIDPLDVPK